MTSNVIVGDKLFEYLKLVELAIVMVLGSVEDERTFSNELLEIEASELVDYPFGLGGQSVCTKKLPFGFFLFLHSNSVVGER